ncbi:NAD(P)-binding domain-containing protein [Microvirga calopogonii]|uniref:NAD(P)-binding domain-containing protein n=1 Tax=Microvirga calopogonii TaxID=2078013 RepID=UPI000E0D5127|nr:NAD(P)-binding domain-containing protein [Microvirga calopogonii]
MTSDIECFDVAVIGAGWAGLGVSYYLAQAGLRHCVLECSRIGETWRTQRWDTFRLNTPNWASMMPGDRYDGPDPDGFMTRDAFVALLEDFAARNHLPVETQTPVSALTFDGEQDRFRLETRSGVRWARNVVIASGSLNRPRRPKVATGLPAGLLQLDASDYRNPASLPAGAVLVVGSAQCGGQIAEDLVQAGRRVFLATGRVGRGARRYRGHDIVFWFTRSGLFDLPRKEFVDASGYIMGRPLLGAGRTLSLQSLSAQGVVLLGRLVGIEDGSLTFAGDLEENLRFGDEVSKRIKRSIDAYITSEDIDAPASDDDPAETIAAHLPDPPILSLDPAEAGIASLIWCTGFEGEFGWVQVPGVLDSRGQPVHEEGVTAQPGLYFAGLDFGSTRNSGTLLSLAKEGQQLVSHLLTRRAPAPRGDRDSSDILRR